VRSTTHQRLGQRRATSVGNRSFRAAAVTVPRGGFGTIDPAPTSSQDSAAAPRRFPFLPTGYAGFGLSPGPTLPLLTAGAVTGAAGAVSLLPEIGLPSTPMISTVGFTAP
jgi:hypothetical protein